MTILNRVGADEVPYVIWISKNEEFGSIKRDSTAMFMVDTNRVDPYHYMVTKDNFAICKAVKHGNDWELLTMWGEVIQKLPDCEGSNQELIISILLAAIQLVERWADYRKGVKKVSDDFDSKRPDHPDFMTHGELKKIEFSGVRHNSISNEVEIWAAGEIRETIPRTALILDAQLAIAQAIERVFGIHYVIVGESKNALKLH